MRDELATILRLVAEGKLSADEAAPIIEALSLPAHQRPAAHAAALLDRDFRRAARRGESRRVRIQVNERGRRVVDLRVPLGFAAAAARMIPGIPDSYATLIQRAVESPAAGVIVDTEDESGDGVVISLE